jgi:hypothetical protein
LGISGPRSPHRVGPPGARAVRLHFRLDADGREGNAVCPALRTSARRATAGSARWSCVPRSPYGNRAHLPISTAILTSPSAGILRELGAIRRPTPQKHYARLAVPVPDAPPARRRTSATGFGSLACSLLGCDNLLFTIGTEAAQCLKGRVPCGRLTSEDEGRAWGNGSHSRSQSWKASECFSDA